MEDFGPKDDAWWEEVGPLEGKSKALKDFAKQLEQKVKFEKDFAEMKKVLGGEGVDYAPLGMELLEKAAKVKAKEDSFTKAYGGKSMGAAASLAHFNQMLAIGQDKAAVPWDETMIHCPQCQGVFLVGDKENWVCYNCGHHVKVSIVKCYFCEKDPGPYKVEVEGYTVCHACKKEMDG